MEDSPSVPPTSSAGSVPPTSSAGSVSPTSSAGSVSPTSSAGSVPPTSSAAASVPARLSLVTLGVADLVRATEFYLALGWPLSSASVAGEVSFFRTAGGLLALWGAADLAADAGQSGSAPTGFRGVSLAINVDGPADVDAALATAVAAGGALVKPAAATEWGGYSGYFTDPDGHLWEVAHNPFWPIGDDDRPRLP